MALTDNCDLYAAVHEDGVNRAIRHLMRQRPSLFNYATADIAQNRELWCHRKIDVTGDVVKFNQPLFTIVPPVPILGSVNPLVLTGFCAQLVKAAIDFHPGKSIALPPQLAPPLKEQHFSLHFTVCAGLACASERELEQIPVGGAPAVELSPSLVGHREDPKYPPVVIRGRPLCFCLDVFVVGRFELIAGRLVGKVEGIEIVDITPDGLEANLECYLKMTVNVVLRQRLAIALDALALSFPLLGMGTVTLAPTGNPPVPFNPAIEDDQLKAFVTLTT
ncbi:MAG: hypothetical protein AB7H93_06060 [Vicinamibacterales bacterium]